MPSSQPRDRLLSAALDRIWSQWITLGLAGAGKSDDTVVDPEALLLATALFGRYDPRLFDEVLDWLSRYSRTLDVTRVRKMAARMPRADKRIVIALTDFMRGHSTRWQGSADSFISEEAQSTYAPQPMFLESQGRGLPVFGEKDPFFAEHGLERPPLELRGMSEPPDLRKPALARLRLRALTGAGVRAEVLLYLGTHERAHGRLIAARSGFSQRQASEYLSQLADAGFAEKWEDGRIVHYRLTEDCSKMVGPVAKYVDWPAAWALAAELWAALEAAAGQDTPYAKAKSWRATLEAVKKLAPVEGLNVPLPQPEMHPGEALLWYADEYVERVATAIAGGSVQTT